MFPIGDYRWFAGNILHAYRVVWYAIRQYVPYIPGYFVYPEDIYISRTLRSTSVVYTWKHLILVLAMLI